MKRRVRNFCLICILVLGFSSTALAHRVNIFAYVDGDAVQVECSFSKSQKVKHGKLTFSDGETGATLLEGVTDEEGMFRFRPEERFLHTGHGLDILLYAGEGHQSTWRMEADELKALVAHSSQKQPSKEATLALNSMGSKELEEIFGRILEEKLAPLRQALARQQENSPGLRDIIGGLGWILGLLGLAAYLRYKPRP